jgi:hypothetical protein
MAELADERWVHGCLQVGDTIGHYAALAGFAPRVACRGTDYLFAQSLVRAGVGIGMIPSVALSPDTQGLAVVALDPPRPARYVGVVTARRRRPQPLAAALLDALRETWEASRDTAGTTRPVTSPKAMRVPSGPGALADMATSSPSCRNVRVVPSGSVNGSVPFQASSSIEPRWWEVSRADRGAVDRQVRQHLRRRPIH